MSSLPKHPEIVHALNPLADKYFELGTQLNIKHQQLKKIEDNYKGSQSRCLIETIILWQQNNATDKCTWSALAKAVERIGGYDNLVKELEVRDHDAMESQRHVSSMIVDRSNIPSITPSQSRTRDLRRPLRHDSTKSVDESGYSSKSESFGSETECFELSPGCGCTNEKPCSLYKVCAGECPNPTGRVPILRKRCTASPQHEIPFEEEPDFEDYEESTREILRSFGDFVVKTSQIFQANNVNIEDLNLYIQCAYPVMKPTMDEMSKATSMANVFRIIVKQSCSWFDYEIIKDLIHQFCTSAKSCLAEYNARFEKYTEQRLPKGKKHIKVGHGARKGGKQLVIKIDREWEKVTFSDLDKLRGTFASILGIQRKDLYLADIREGCIMMTFMITEELARRLFPPDRCLNSSQTKSLKDEGVRSLTCDKWSWRVAVKIRDDQSVTKMDKLQKSQAKKRQRVFDAVTTIFKLILILSLLWGLIPVTIFFCTSTSQPGCSTANFLPYSSTTDVGYSEVILNRTRDGGLLQYMMDDGRIQFKVNVSKLNVEHVGPGLYYIKWKHGPDEITLKCRVATPQICNLTVRPSPFHQEVHSQTLSRGRELIPFSPGARVEAYRCGENLEWLCYYGYNTNRWNRNGSATVELGDFFVNRFECEVVHRVSLNETYIVQWPESGNINLQPNVIVMLPLRPIEPSYNLPPNILIFRTPRFSGKHIDDVSSLMIEYIPPLNPMNSLLMTRQMCTLTSDKFSPECVPTMVQEAGPIALAMTNTVAVKTAVLSLSSCNQNLIPILGLLTFCCRTAMVSFEITSRPISSNGSQPKKKHFILCEVGRPGHPAVKFPNETIASRPISSQPKKKHFIPCEVGRPGHRAVKFPIASRPMALSQRRNISYCMCEVGRPGHPAVKFPNEILSNYHLLSFCFLL